jgi:hypothetical protein
MMGVMAWGLGRDGESKKLERELRRLNRAGGATDPAPLLSRRVFGGMRRLWCACCLNWKVVAAVGAVGVGLAAFSPRLFASAGPGLLLLICPVSMVVTIVAMNRRGRRPAGSPSAVEPAPPPEQTATPPAVAVTPAVAPRETPSLVADRHGSNV